MEDDKIVSGCYYILLSIKKLLPNTISLST